MNTKQIPSKSSERLTYNSWQKAKQRCYNQNHHKFPTYGEKGITMCEEWKNNFAQFFKDMGRRPSLAHTLDRIDNTKGYSLDNCRWATAKVQNRNKSNNIVLRAGNTLLVLAQWAELCQISYHTLYARVRSGQPIHKAVSVPVRKYSKKQNS